MIKGIIENGFNGIGQTTELNPCDLLMAVGIRELEDGPSSRKYKTQCMLLGRKGIPSHVVECLAESIVSILVEYGGDKPAEALRMLADFQRQFEEESAKYLIEHFDGISIKDILRG